MISYLEGWFVSCHHLLVAVNLFSSNVFLAMASASLRDLQDIQENITWVPEVDVVAG